MHIDTRAKMLVPGNAQNNYTEHLREKNPAPCNISIICTQYGPNLGSSGQPSRVEGNEAFPSSDPPGLLVPLAPCSGLLLPRPAQFGAARHQKTFDDQGPVRLNQCLGVLNLRPAAHGSGYQVAPNPRTSSAHKAVPNISFFPG